MRPRDGTAGEQAAPSGISSELVASYTRAVYRVDASPRPIFLRVGEASPELEGWIAATGASRFAFISAANPGSLPLSDDENRRRHERLRARVSAIGLRATAGESCEAETGGWREASLLVAGIDRGSALALAREFGQVALLYGEIGGPIELLPATGPPGGIRG